MLLQRARSTPPKASAYRSSHSGDERKNPGLKSGGSIYRSLIFSRGSLEEIGVVSVKRIIAHETAKGEAFKNNPNAVAYPGVISVSAHSIRSTSSRITLIA